MLEGSGVVVEAVEIGGVLGSPVAADEGGPIVIGGDDGVGDLHGGLEADDVVFGDCEGGIAAAIGGRVCPGVDVAVVVLRVVVGGDGLAADVVGAFGGFAFAGDAVESGELEVELVVAGGAGLAEAAADDEEALVAERHGAQGQVGAIAGDVDGGVCDGVGVGGGELDVRAVDHDDVVGRAGGEAGESGGEIGIRHLAGGERREGAGLGELLVIGLAADAGDGIILPALAFLPTGGGGRGGEDGGIEDVPSGLGTIGIEAEHEVRGVIEDAFAL